MDRGNDKYNDCHCQSDLQNDSNSSVYCFDCDDWKVDIYNRKGIPQMRKMVEIR